MIEIPSNPTTTMQLLQTPSEDENRRMTTSMMIPTKLWNLRPHCVSPIIPSSARKQVRFATSETASPSTASPLNRLPVDQWKTLWYSQEELHAIKSAVYLVCRQLKQHLKGSQNPSLSVSEETRGLEQRCCMERQRRKFLTLRYVLKMSRHPDMARRACICSQWASQLANDQAQRDHVNLKRSFAAVEPSSSKRLRR